MEQSVSRVLILEPLPSHHVDDLVRDFDAGFFPEAYSRPLDFTDQLASATILVTRNKTLVDKTLLKSCNQLQMVYVYGSGADHIDLDECRNRGVKVVTAAGLNANAVAEFTILLMLGLLRKLRAAEQMATQMSWSRDQLVGGDLAGSHVHLIGCGATALATAKRLQVFDCEVTYSRRQPSPQADFPGEFVEIEEGLGRCDLVSLHCPALPEPILDQIRLKMLRPHALVINTSRGANIDQRELFKLLDQGRLGGAALDVLEMEPPQEPITDRSNCIITPHIAGLSESSLNRIHRFIYDEVKHGFQP